jgi:putative ABC transport system substrate-binding protein
VATGLVASLRRPGGNVTGVSITATETSQKAYDLLRELAPGARRLVFLTDTAHQGAAVAFSRMEERARAQEVSLQMMDGARPEALEHALDTIRSEKIQGMVVGVPGTLLRHRDRIVRFAAQEKLPVVYNRIDFMRAGGLASFGVDRSLTHARAADIVKRILAGAKPADIPVEQINRTQLVLNLKTARALGLRVPEAVRLRANEVIE